MRIVFNIKNPTTGNDYTGLTLNPVIYRKLSSGNFSALNTLTATISELANGDYELSFNEPSGSYEYLRIYIYFGNDILKRFTVYPDQFQTNIAQAVWEYSGPRSLNSVIISQNVSLPTNQTIGALIWEHTAGSGRRLTSPQLGNSNTVTGETQYLITTENAASAVWGNQLNQRTLTSYPISEIAAAVWNDVPTRTVTSIDTAAISNAVWGRQAGDSSSRTLTSHPSVDLSALAEKSDISDAIAALEAYGQEHWQTATGFVTLAELQSNIASAGAIAQQLWTEENIQLLANAVLTTDTGSLPVTTEAYTVKHLIMASQRSRIIPWENSTTRWEILDGDPTSPPIATRQITLNSTTGAIETVDQPEEQE